MDETLALHPLHSLLPLDQPFTPAMARAVGIERSTLEKMLRDGQLRRLLRGVYVASTALDTILLRASAVALVVMPGDVVVDRTAAWVHGALVEDPVPLDVVARARSQRSALGGRRTLASSDVQSIGGARVTTPVRTAADLGRVLPADRAIGVLDALLRSGGFTQSALLAELPRFARLRGCGQLRVLAAQVDARSAGPAESLLRLHWHAANLPTAVPGLLVAAGTRMVRLALGVERRQFGAVLAHQVAATDLLALEGAGWWVVVLHEDRLLRTDPDIWTRHLEREFHQQLLTQVNDDREIG